MKWKERTIIVSILFYAVMLILTASARIIHNSTLPKVTVGYLEGQRFQQNESYNEKDILTKVLISIGIPKTLYESQHVYILSKEIINGEERNIAREVMNLEIGRSSDTHYEVIKGISGIDLVILTGGELVEDGQEVYVE